MLLDLVICLLATTPTLTVEVEPGRIIAGRLLIGRATLDGGAEILTAEATFLGHQFALHPEPGGTLPLLLPIPLATPDGPARLLVDVTSIGGDQLSSLTEVTVRAHLPPVPDPWERLDPEVAALADPAVAAVEAAELTAVLARVTPGRRQWDAEFQEAVRGPVMARFGAVRTLQAAGHEGPLHLGVDYERRRRASVATAAAGNVVAVHNWPLLGETVVVDHGQGIVTLYAHLDIALVATGDRLARGTVLGWAGFSGLSDGVMVHVGAFAHGVPIDPAGLLDLPRWLRRPVDAVAADALDARRRALLPTPAPPARPPASPATAASPTDLLLESPASEPLTAATDVDREPGNNRADAEAASGSGTHAATPAPEAAPAAPPIPEPTAIPAAARTEIPPLELSPDLAPSVAEFLRELYTRLHQQLPGAVLQIGLGPRRQGAPATDFLVTFHDLGSMKFPRAAQLAIELTGRLAPPSLSSSSRLTVIHAPTQTTIPLLIKDARSFVSAARGD